MTRPLPTDPIMTQLPSTLRERLRSATAARHEALEGTPILARLMSGHATMEDYRHFLQRQLRITRPLESRLTPWLTPEEAALRLQKSDWLQQDLKHLGAMEAEGEAAPPETPSISSRSAAMGVLYVLEGSTMGGRVLGRKLRESPELSLEGVDRFLVAYGERGGSLWGVFIDQLEQLPRAEWERTETAAVETFDLFLDQWMDNPAKQRV